MLQNCSVNPTEPFGTFTLGVSKRFALKDKSKSGLFHATDILKNVSGIGFVSLNEKDVVRHHLVKKIILAYDK